MYHAMLVVGLCVAYVPLAYGFAWFFEDRRVTLDPWRTLSSIAAIALVATAANVVTLQVSDWQLANRILHTFGGGFAAYLQVYGRAGKPCRRCGTAIKKIRLASRGTHFCSKCQK